MLFLCTAILAQRDFSETRIKISPKSELIIAGSTNVNKFDCKFDSDLIKGNREIEYSKGEKEIRFKGLSLKLATDAFDCAHRRMNEDLQDLLKFDEYPAIVLEINKVELISEEFVRAFITVNLAGGQKDYELPVHINDNNFEGEFNINIRDFGLEPPKKAMGLVQVREIIEVQFNLKVLR